MPTQATKPYGAMVRLRSVIMVTMVGCYCPVSTLSQTSDLRQNPPNYVSGQGLSPSYFLPPSADSLIENTPANLPLAPVPPLVGSGVSADPYTFVPSDVSQLQDHQIQSDPLKNSNRQTQPTPVDLDLRSYNSSVGTDSSSLLSQRPLAPPSPWFFSSNALILNLQQQDDQFLSISALDPSIRQLGTKDVSMPSAGGFELGIGRYFGCGKYALSASYWGLSPEVSVASVSVLNPGELATSLPFNLPSSANPGVTQGLFVGSTPLSDLFDSSSEHRLACQREFNNLEISLFWFAIGGLARQPIAANCIDGRSWNLSDHPTATNAPWLQTPSRFRLSLFTGVRWFQFQDQLRYSAKDVYYENRVRNDLWGVQSGANVHFLLNSRWTIWSSINAGLHNNHRELDTASGSRSSLAKIVSNGASNGTDYIYDTSSNGLSFLGETTTGLAWHFARGWTSNLGYRVLGASGIATAPSQIPSDFRFLGQAIQSSDSLILHGITLGATYNF